MIFLSGRTGSKDGSLYPPGIDMVMVVVGLSGVVCLS